MDGLMDGEVYRCVFKPIPTLGMAWSGLRWLSEFTQISDPIGTGTSEISVDVFGWFTGKAIQLVTYELDPMLPIDACR